MISSTNGRGKTIPLKQKKRVKIEKKDKKKTRLKLPVVIMTLVLVSLAFSLVGEMKKLEGMRHNVQEIEQEIEQLQSKNDELHKTLDMLKSNDYVEQVARENLGLVKPGESLIVPVEQEKPANEE